MQKEKAQTMFYKTQQRELDTVVGKRNKILIKSTSSTVFDLEGENSCWVKLIFQYIPNLEKLIDPRNYYNHINCQARIIMLIILYFFIS